MKEMNTGAVYIIPRSLVLLVCAFVFLNSGGLQRWVISPTNPTLGIPYSIAHELQIMSHTQGVLSLQPPLVYGCLCLHLCNVLKYYAYSFIY